VAVFYIWTTTSSQNDFQWSAKKVDHYNLLAEGFLSGHLYLSLKPPPEMLALKDPLDPVANRDYRLHDASLYRGKYYLYFGPVPALTLYLPWRWITGSGIPNNLAVVIYLLAGYVFSCLVLFSLLDACGIHPSWFATRVAIAALGLCQVAPVILRRAMVYETAVAAAFCVFVAGMYFLTREVLAGQPTWRSALAGLLLGMAPGCRPNYAPAVMLVFVVFLGYLWSRRTSRRELLLHALYVGAPLTVCGLLLGWYNFARFGSLTEFGQSYQLVFDAADRGVVRNFSSVLPVLYRLLIERPLMSRSFPFLELSTNGPFGGLEWAPGVTRVEPMAGLLIISPLCVAGLLAPYFLYRFRAKMPAAVRFSVISLYVSLMANLASLILVIREGNQRYELDFAPSLLLISLFIVLFLSAQCVTRWMKVGSAIVLTLAVGLSCAMQSCLSINGYDYSLLRTNLPAFNRLASFFGDDEMSIRRWVFGLSLQGQIAFPRQSPNRREAILTTGFRGRSNSVFVEYLGNDRIRFGYKLSGSPPTLGPDTPITPQKAYRIDLRYVDASRSLRVLLDDVVALEMTSFIYPASFGSSTVGKNAIGEPQDVRAFSGEITAPNGLVFAAATQ
jgi:hypothetical protein